MHLTVAFLTTFFVSLEAQSTKQTVNEGNDLFVFCNGERTPDFSVFWANSNLQYHQDGSSLIINEISRNYAEYYECFEVDPSTNVTNKIFGASVDVTYPAKILASKYNATLVENETFSMEITVEGNPVPDIKMVQISNSAVAYQTANQGNFNISFVAHCSNMGSYLLTCSNELNYDRLVLDMTVFCIPRPDPGKSITFIHKPRVGEYVQLEMVSIGYPAPTFTWYHGDITIAHVDTEQTSVVDIRGIKIEDFGNYTLRMSNSVGQNTYQYWIEADGPPDSATDLQVETVTINSATLSWLPGFDYGNIQTFTVILSQNGKKQELDKITLDDHTTDRVSHTVTNLYPATTYDMQIKSSNSKGEAASLSNAVTFQTDKPATPKPSEASRLYSSILQILLLSVITRL